MFKITIPLSNPQNLNQKNETEINKRSPTKEILSIKRFFKPKKHLSMQIII